MQASYHPEQMRRLFPKPYCWLVSLGLVLTGMPSAIANPQPVHQPLAVLVEPTPTVITNGSGVKRLPLAIQPVAQTITQSTAPGKSKTVGEAPKLNNKKDGQVARPFVVMIDPGHGGKDPGAIGVNNLREIDVIFPIALQVSEILKKNGVTVQLTRDRDYFVGLDERVQMSAQAKADIFVSIHANSIDNRPDVHGLETYHYNIGEDLANTVHNRIINVFNNDLKIPLNDRRIRSARFLVLRKSNIPAILVETGYLSSPEEVVQLGKAQYQTNMAQAIAQGILEYIKKIQSSPQPNVQQQS
jgi:N-acetylmuramoyl-L-alanine amidase